MRNVSGGELLVECLLAQEVSTVFGVPGESYLPVLDALYGVSSRVRTVMCRQEGGAGYMAEAYAKFTGEPGICFVTRGPGATNASIAVHTAKQNSTAMILFVGQVGRSMKGREAFQEIDYTKFFGDAAKWAVEIDVVERIPEIVGRAFAVCRSGRPGPVVVSLPEDVLSRQSTAEPIPRVLVAEAEISAETLRRIFTLLARSKCPVVLVGGGGWTDTGRSNLRRFAERNELPVVTGFRCHDLMDNHSACYVGDAGIGLSSATRSLFDEADLILVIGLDLGEITTDGYSLLELPVPRQTFIQVHACSAEIGKVYQASLPVHCGPNVFVAAAAAHEAVSARRWLKRLATARRDFLASLECPPQPGAVDMGVISNWLRDNLAEDVVVTNGAGNFTVWPNKFLLYGRQARLLAPQSGAMGYGVPAAIAAKIAAPDRTVVCFAGDGDFQMNGQELATAAQHHAQPIVLLLNNGMYGTIRMHQERRYPDRVHGTALVNPDFELLAGAYGFHYDRVDRTAAFEAAFQRARESTSGALIELIIDPEALTPGQTLSQIRRTTRDADSV